VEISGASLATFIHLPNPQALAADRRSAQPASIPSSSLPAQESLAARGRTIDELVGLNNSSRHDLRGNNPVSQDSSLSQVQQATTPSLNLATDAQSQQELAQIQELARIDQEVRAHELAHASVGGSFAGGTSFSFTRGPDGRLYATGGEVSIDISTVANNPQATIEKARVIIAAATAPANPSAQDLRVAARAQAMLVNAQAGLLALEESPSEQKTEDEVAAVDETDLSSEQQSAAVALREEEQEKQERIQELREEFAAQLSDLNSRLNQVHRNLIDAGVIENPNPGAIIDMLI
jgi:hypothetical protein